MPSSGRVRAAPRLFVAFALALSPALAAAAAAADDGGNLRVQIRGEEGAKLDLDLSLGWLTSFIDWSDFECDADSDRDTRRMARSLDRQGEGGVYEFDDDDGDHVVARREHGTLRIESRERGGERAKVEMPWPLAECLFLGREPAGGLAKALGDGDFEVKIEGRDGGKISIDVD